MKKILALAVIGMALLGMGVAAVSAGSGTTVQVLGSEVLQPNVRIFSDFRFSPGPTTIKSGDSITWDDKTGDPHTITLATQNQLATQIEDLFAGTCAPCTAAINAAIFGHFVQGLPTLDPDNDGKFDSPGDSMLLPPNGTRTAQIQVPAGTTLYYFCALHPWMQGEIDVK